MAARKVFELMYPNAAGIDIGSASHYVAVPADRDEQPVREFKSFTEDLVARRRPSFPNIGVCIMP